MKRVLAVVLAYCVLFPPAFSAVPAADTIRDSLGEFFQIYLTVPARRHARERVVVRGDERTGQTAEIWYWRSLEQRDPNDEICNAYRWFLFGRGKYGHGAAEAFKKFPTLSEIQLHFFHVETGTKLGKNKGEVLPTERVVPYLKLTIRKNSLSARKADWASVKKRMSGGGAACRDAGRAVMDEQWLDEAYVKRGR